MKEQQCADRSDRFVADRGQRNLRVFFLLLVHDTVYRRRSSLGTPPPGRRFLSVINAAANRRMQELPDRCILFPIPYARHYTSLGEHQVGAYITTREWHLLSDTGTKRTLLSLQNAFSAACRTAMGAHGTFFAGGAG